MNPRRTIGVLRTLVALGPLNVVRVAIYRAWLRLPFSAVRRLPALAVPSGVFFGRSAAHPSNAPAVSNWRAHGLLFGYIPFAISAAPPDWLADPLSGAPFPGAERDWWRVPDFDPAVGDIKRIWELSRFDWVVAFAQHARNGDQDALTRLNCWLSDWSLRNPPFKGPNWKCGQEASIRVMHLATGALILRRCTITAPLQAFVELHARRIAPTMSYAIAQDNNHGVSEAAALFIAGVWLRDVCLEARNWENIGRRGLEERALRLIQKDGSFSQYSTNYHRLMLDAYSLCEIWRRHWALPEFSTPMRERLIAATDWLQRLTNPNNGDAPNLGANDGARLLPLTDAAYRDHRPSVALARALLDGKRAWSNPGGWEDALRWLDVPVPQTLCAPLSSDAGGDGGFAALKCDGTMAVLRYPRFRFRPSQCDLLHVDLWRGCENLLRDAGSYSYNAEPEWLDYFPGVRAHNTIEFDDEEQMPRYGRFLFGDWPRADRVEPLIDRGSRVSFGAGYKDRRGCAHHRRVDLTRFGLSVEDDVAGFDRKAVLRWRLSPGAWTRDGHLVRSDFYELSVACSVPITSFELATSWESARYLEKTATPALEVEIRQAGKILTEIRWAK